MQCMSCDLAHGPISAASSWSRPSSTALTLSSRILIASGTNCSGSYCPVDSTLTNAHRSASLFSILREANR